METDWIDVGLKLVLGILGILVFAIWKVRDKLREFNFGTFIRENKAFWIWSLSMVVVLLLIVTIEPESGEAIKTMTGLDVKGTRPSFLSLGWALSIAANNLTSNPIGKKPQ